MPSSRETYRDLAGVRSRREINLEYHVTPAGAAGVLVTPVPPSIHLQQEIPRSRTENLSGWMRDTEQPNSEHDIYMRYQFPDPEGFGDKEPLIGGSRTKKDWRQMVRKPAALDWQAAAKAKPTQESVLSQLPPYSPRSLPQRSPSLLCGAHRPNHDITGGGVLVPGPSTCVPRFSSRVLG